MPHGGVCLPFNIAFLFFSSLNICLFFTLFMRRASCFTFDTHALARSHAHAHFFIHALCLPSLSFVTHAVKSRQAACKKRRKGKTGIGQGYDYGILCADLPVTEYECGF
jgi:hypothetical protein